MSVIAWNSHETVKCPPGTLAWHAQHGRVRVLKADGWKRLVEVRADARIVAASGAPVVFPERRLLLVDVRELERWWQRWQRTAEIRRVD
jgi:hypothetical protein